MVGRIQSALALSLSFERASACAPSRNLVLFYKSEGGVRVRVGVCARAYVYIFCEGVRIRNAIMDDRWMKKYERKREKEAVISILRWIFRDIRT